MVHSGFSYLNGVKLFLGLISPALIVSSFYIEIYINILRIWDVFNR